MSNTNINSFFSYIMSCHRTNVQLWIGINIHLLRFSYLKEKNHMKITQITILWRQIFVTTETSQIQNSSQQKTCFYSFGCCCWPDVISWPTATVKRIKKTKGHSECPSVTSRDNWKENNSVIPWRDGVSCQGKAKEYSQEYPFALPWQTPRESWPIS